MKLSRLLLMIFLLFPMVAFGESASSLMSRAVKELHKSRSITADYTISSGGERTSGTITVEDSRFKIVSRQMKVWYDGKTQWTLDPVEKEVSLTEPDGAELQQVNPFAVIDSYSRVYNSKMLKSTVAGKQVVELTPKKQGSGIKTVVITLDGKNLKPEKLVITMSSRSVVTITIGSIRSGQSLPVSSFRPSSADLRGYETVDLR